MDNWKYYKYLSLKYWTLLSRQWLSKYLIIMGCGNVQYMLTMCPMESSISRKKLYCVVRFFWGILLIYFVFIKLSQESTTNSMEFWIIPDVKDERNGIHSLYLCLNSMESYSFQTFHRGYVLQMKNSFFTLENKSRDFQTSFGEQLKFVHTVSCRLLNDTGLCCTIHLSKPSLRVMCLFRHSND